MVLLCWGLLFSGLLMHISGLRVPRLISNMLFTLSRKMRRLFVRLHQWWMGRVYKGNYPVMALRKLVEIIWTFLWVVLAYYHLRQSDDM